MKRKHTSVAEPSELSESELTGSAELLHASGRIILGFQGIEQAILGTYLAFFKPDAWDVSSVVFYSVRTFDARLTTVDTLVRQFCGSKLLNDWAAIAKAIKKRNRVRNAVAHGTATIFGSAPSRKWGVGSSPFDLDRFSGSTDANDYYTVKELNEADAGLAELRELIDRFSQKLAADSALQSRLGEQPRGVVQNLRNTRIVARTRK